MASLHQALQRCGIEAFGQRARFDVGDAGQPLRGIDLGGLQQHAAKEPVHRTDIQWRQRFRHLIQKFLQLLRVQLVKRVVVVR